MFVRRFPNLRQVDWLGEGVPFAEGLCSKWYAERFHRNVLVKHFQQGQLCCATRRLENYAIPRCRLHQCAPQRRHPTDVVAVEIDLIGAQDAHHSLCSRGIGIAHSRSENADYQYGKRRLRQIVQCESIDCHKALRMWVVRYLFIRCRFDSALKIPQARSTNEIGATPQKSLPAACEDPVWMRRRSGNLRVVL
jgi:hypothetical protein